MRSRIVIFAALLLCFSAFGQDEAALPGVAGEFPDAGPAAAVSSAPAHGTFVESTGYPVNPDYQEFQGDGILWFGVSSNGGTVSCYAEGTNTWLLRDIRNRIVRVVEWNGKRLAEGATPVSMTVEGTYDGRRDAIHVSEMRIPRGLGNALVEPVVWDVIDPNRGEEVATAEYYEYDYGVPAAAYAEPQPVVVNNYYYNYSVYDEGYDYPRYYSRYPNYYSGGYYPIYVYPSRPHKPHHPIHRPGHRPDHDRDHGRKRSSTFTSPGVYSGFYFPPAKPTIGRAERWGLARQISRKFTNPSLSTTYKPYLNPSQLPEFQQEHGRFGGSDGIRHRGVGSRSGFDRGGDSGHRGGGRPSSGRHGGSHR